MQWNIAAEGISVVFLLIIWVYSRKSNLVPSLKNRLFQMCFMLTGASMLFNILSTAMLANPQVAPSPLAWLITLIYFAITPLMGLAYFYYTLATVYEEKEAIKGMRYCAFPGVLYLIMVAVAPWQNMLFHIDATGQYTQGPWISSTYVVFYLYCFAALFAVVLRRKQVEPIISRILVVFPVIAFLVIVVQQFYPTVILSGSAATGALIIIYLYLQNKQNSIDYLTGLPNRQEFLKMLNLQIKRSQSFYLTILSLRDFKRVNNTYGQYCGDLFLQEVAAYLGEVSHAYCLYRYGGDEFAILSDKQEDQKSMLEEIRIRIQQPWRAGKNQCDLGAAIGVVRYPESADTVEGLVSGIEYAVGRAKATGEIYYCGQEMLAAIRRRASIVQILENCLANQGFQAFFQPVYSVAAERYTVAEALLRIPESELGPLFPDEFIPIAEETGLIVEITYQVLEQCCAFVNRIAAAGIPFEGVQINFSGHQFSQLDLVERVEEVIQRNGTPFSQIKIEITESILAEKTEVVTDFALKMQRHGVLVELDDFGTGYSNMRTVMNTPLDIVKLDRSLLWSAVEHARSASMFQGMTAIFHEMGLQVLAEGVETLEQDTLARSWGVDLLQGFLFSRPLPPEAAFIFFLEKSGISNPMTPL